MNTTIRILQKENTESLCGSIVGHASQYSTPVSQAAQLVSRKFSVAFELFEKCHSIYDQCQVSSGDISTLGKKLCFIYLTETYCELFLGRTKHSLIHEVLQRQFPESYYHTQTSYA